MSNRHLACKVNKCWSRLSLVEKIANTPIRPMSLQRLLKTNSTHHSALVKNAEWVRQELYVRFAHRLRDFHRLPLIVAMNPEMKTVYDLYTEGFEAVYHQNEVVDTQSREKLISFLAELYEIHRDVINNVGRGIKQLKSVFPEINLEDFLEKFFYSRIARRVMIDHLVLLHNPPGADWAGCVHLKCNPADIIKAKAEEVAESCRAAYGISPAVNVTGNTAATLSTVPDHVALIMTETLKNAMRATTEFHTMGNSINPGGGLALGEDLPPVQVEIFKGKDGQLN
eukprot:GHVL01019054.1.p1 GENE.GHVL01019054.1~~GHVL01019054.1.p1  ORF type:complete len:292 (+),score=55.82 GHVL01019054.1:30-878(+)